MFAVLTECDLTQCVANVHIADRLGSSDHISGVLCFFAE
jgi:hypothetical protein